MGYSLWLIPVRNSSLEQLLRATIQSLGGSFTPHVTLISKIPLSKSKEEIQSSLISYFNQHPLPEVHIQQLDTGSEFFKRIFLRCHKTDSLVSLARYSKETFIHDQDDIEKWTQSYDPHISLMYANKEDCNDQELMARINLSAFLNKTWQGGQIHLVDTSGPLADWKTVLEFDIPH